MSVALNLKILKPILSDYKLLIFNDLKKKKKKKKVYLLINFKWFKCFLSLSLFRD